MISSKTVYRNDADLRNTVYKFLIVYSSTNYFGGAVRGPFSDLSTFEGQPSAEVIFKMWDDFIIGQVVFFQKSVWRKWTMCRQCALLAKFEACSLS